MARREVSMQFSKEKHLKKRGIKFVILVDVLRQN